MNESKNMFGYEDSWRHMKIQENMFTACMRVCKYYHITT